MKRRAFVKVSSTLAVSGALSPAFTPQPDEPLLNWAGNIAYSTQHVAYPQSVTDLQQLVKKHSHLKVLGSRHCFNRIADSKDQFVSLKKMNQVVALDAASRTVTVEGGINYGQLSPYLHEKGFALHNLASLPHISVVGACMTATHGSGVANGNLATAVEALEFISADGTVHTLSRKKDGETFSAAVVGLGALGVVTKITLAIQPTFQMRQRVYERLPMAQLKENFEKIVSAGYSVSLFTDWQSDSINEVWVKTLAKEAAAEDVPTDFFGAKAATQNMHPIADLSAENCTEQMGVLGPWYERLPHFRIGFTPSSGKELQAEYFVPRSQAVDAIAAVAKIGKEIGPHLFISEIRTIDADQLWLSPCYQQPSITIHFTWKQDWPAVSALLPRIENALAPFNAKPHWGKLFTLSPAALQQRYEKLPAFKQLIQQYDPQGKFRNEFLNTYLYTR